MKITNLEQTVLFGKTSYALLLADSVKNATPTATKKIPRAIPKYNMALFF
ncbi:MAG TPA: hypothetical protein PLK12_08000 [Prolixibacteraceae bacterium]|nr:hypothetical protein [Prolixibacteraceae bacterium]